MSAIIRKKNVLLEDDMQQNNNQQQPAPAAPVNNAPQQPAPATPQNNNAPAQPAASAQDNNQQQQQTPQQNQQQQQPQQNNDLAQKMNTFFSNVENNLQQNGIYWALAYNLPEELQKAVPEFKQDNPNAKAGLDAWSSFKASPSKDSFTGFVNALNQFAGVGQQQPQQSAQDNAVQNNQQQESYSRTFGEKLNERISEAKQMDFYRHSIEKSFEGFKI